MNPKAILGFLKKNLISVISLVVAVIGAPVMFYFSSGMVTSLTDEVQSDVSRRENSIRSNSRVTYEIPPTTLGEDAWSESGPPHEAVISDAVSVMRTHNAASERVRQLVLDRNRREGSLLLGDDTRRLLPSPESDSVRVQLLTRLIDAYPAFHADLLRNEGFGVPPSPDEVTDQLRAVYEQQFQALADANEDREPTDEQLDQLAARLGAQRLAMYRDRAQGLVAYASTDVFLAVQPWAEAGIPRLGRAWDWQLHTWVHVDVVGGLRRANTGDDGSLLGPMIGPLKRVLSIDVRRVEGENDRFGGGRGGRGGRGGGMDEGGGGPVTASLASALPRDYAASHTGRMGWPASPNGYYDTLLVDLVLIADPNQLQRVIDAIQSVNLMTVVDVDYSQIEPYRDLANGFMYGSGPVAEVRMTVETVWLRAWLGDLMPDATRTEWRFPPRPAPMPESDADASSESGE